MPDLIEYKTEFGSYWVTAEDARLLLNDMVLWGTLAILTQLDGDRVIGRRVSPAELSADMLKPQEAGHAGGVRAFDVAALAGPAILQTQKIPPQP